MITEHAFAGEPAPEVFAQYDRAAARWTVPIETARTGDLVGAMLFVDFGIGKSGRDTAYPTDVFFVKTEDGVDLSAYEALSEAQKDRAARFAMDLNSVRLNRHAGLRNAMDHLCEFRGATIPVQVACLPDTMLVFTEDGLDIMERNREDEEEFHEEVGQHFVLLVRGADSAHARLANRPGQERDLEILTDVIGLKEDLGDAQEAPVRLTLAR